MCVRNTQTRRVHACGHMLRFGSHLRGLCVVRSGGTYLKKTTYRKLYLFFLNGQLIIIIMCCAVVSLTEGEKSFRYRYIIITIISVKNRSRPSTESIIGGYNTHLTNAHRWPFFFFFENNNNNRSRLVALLLYYYHYYYNNLNSEWAPPDK